MKTAYLMVGISGSGKSTVVSKLKARQVQLDKVRTFSLDSCRLSFAREKLSGNVVQFKARDYVYAPLWENIDYASAFDMANQHKKEFDSYVTREWNSALSADTLYIDNTNLSRKSRARWCTEARQKGFTLWAISVMVPLQLAKDRQVSRGDKDVPASVVEDMFYRQQEVLVGDEVDFLCLVDGADPECTLFSHIHLK